MAKVLVIVVVLLQAMRSAHGLLTFNQILWYLYGIPIGHEDYVGLIGQPTNTLCSIPIVKDYGACFICNIDCIYTHNAFGGDCGPNPRDTWYETCMCARTQGEFTSVSTDTCNTFPGYESIGAVVDIILQIVVELNKYLLLCRINSDGVSYDSSGCAADCYFNHGATSGSCMKEIPVYPATGTVSTVYCKCTY